jgi:hypothetical protein
MGYNDPFQPHSTVVQDQDKKHPFGRWRIAAVVGLITIASIGGFFYLHRNTTYPTLNASYLGEITTNPCSTEGSSLTLYQIVEDRAHGTFTGLIWEFYVCSGAQFSCTGAIQDGTVTTSGDVSFTFVVRPYDPIYCDSINNVNFSGTIQPDGRITGQFSQALGVSGNFDLTAGSPFG